jgi:hypothetical protein
MASEGGQRLLPIPRSARKPPSAEHLQAAHQPGVVSGTRTPEPARPQKVGDSHSVVRTMDPAPDSPAPLSSSSLLRHPSFIRAVCVDTLVRICAGGGQRWSSLLRPEQSREHSGARLLLSHGPIEHPLQNRSEFYFCSSNRHPVLASEMLQSSSPPRDCSAPPLSHFEHRFRLR